MTLDEARESIGKLVVHEPPATKPERGVVVRVNTSYVFVRFPWTPGSSQAAYPQDLTLWDCGRGGCAVGCPHDPGEGHSTSGYAANH